MQLRLQSLCGLADSVLQGSPEVQGSKFVIGAVIPGSNNQATKEDVFVVVCTCFDPFALVPTLSPLIFLPMFSHALQQDSFNRSPTHTCACANFSPASLVLCRFICITYQSRMEGRPGRTCSCRVMFGGSCFGKGDLWSWLMALQCEAFA